LPIAHQPYNTPHTFTAQGKKKLYINVCIR
jgi:hypothetical protein